MGCHVYALVNQKGGIGKTTTVIQMGAGLALRGYKTLLIDMDAQCNMSFSLKGDYQHKPTIMDAILGKVKVEDTIQHLEEVDLIPGSSNLASLESLIDPDGKEFFLEDTIQPLKEIYDYIIIDSPPALSLLTVGIMTAADSLVVPVAMDMYSLQGTGQLYRTYKAVKEYCNENLVIDGILVTKLSVSLKKILEEVAGNMHTRIFKTTISNSVIVAHAAIAQQSLFKYAPNNKVTREYSDFLDELLSIRNNANMNEAMKGGTDNV